METVEPYGELGPSQQLETGRHPFDMEGASASVVGLVESFEKL